MPCPCPICQKKGACCYDGTCTEETCADCETLGGLWQGFGTTCDGSDCPCSTPADHNLCEKCVEGAAEPSCPDDQECCDGRCCGNGDFCCAYGCCYCNYPYAWQIVDDDNHLYASGIVTSGGFYNLPTPFTPLWYWVSGSNIHFSLQVLGCDGATWETVSDWYLPVTLCGDMAARYPEASPVGALSPPWLGGSVPLPSDCVDKLRRCTNDCPEEGCEECPELGVGSAGSGINAIASGVAYKFVGTIDGEWTNLNNWQNANGFSPPASLPGGSDDVVIDANVTTKPTNYTISVASLTINGGKQFAVAAECNTLTCYGTVARPASPVCAGYYGDIWCITSAAFSGGTLEGKILGSPVFDDASNVTASGVVDGNAVFSGASHNAGVVQGNATFNDNSDNQAGGVVNLDGTFNDDSRNLGAVTGTATFNDNACHSGTAGTLVPPSPPSC